MYEHDAIEKLLTTLTRGLAQGSNRDIYNAHRELFKIGEKVIPAVEERILSQPWDKIKYGERLNILSGMLSLVNDISEDRAKNLGKRICNSGCSKVVESRIRSITNFTLSEFNLFPVAGINLYVSKKFNESGRIKDQFENWLKNVPGKDLSEIERMYVVSKSDGDYSGTYTPILCNIMVEWRIPISYSNPLSYFFLLGVEQTLYHEIGHHVHRHTFGQDPDQEKEADRYAMRIFRKTHPVLIVIVRIIKSIFGKPRGC